jgi:hypothetical protein
MIVAERLRTPRLDPCSEQSFPPCEWTQCLVNALIGNWHGDGGGPGFQLKLTCDQRLQCIAPNKPLC